MDICKSESRLVYRGTNRQFPSPRQHISVWRKGATGIYDLACHIELSVMSRITLAMSFVREGICFRVRKQIRLIEINVTKEERIEITVEEKELKETKV